MNQEELAERLREHEGLTVEQREHILEMASSSPARKPGKGALNNVVTHFNSVKCGQLITLESHTVEHLFALTLELDPDVLGYFPQVACKGVRLGSHVRSGTLDFLVVRTRRVELVECKAASARDSLLTAKSGEWIDVDGNLQNLAYGPWARQRGMEHVLWLSPSRVDTPLRNLQVIYNEVRMVPADAAQVLGRRIHAHLADGPKSLDWMIETIEGFNLSQAALLLGTRWAFGPVEHVPLTDTSNFFLTLSQAQAIEIGSNFFEVARHSRNQLNSAFATATLVDATHAEKRLALIQSAHAKGTAVPKHLRGVARNVAEARSRGENELEQCLTRFHASGNRMSRLTPVQEKRTAEAIRAYAAGKYSQKKDAYAALKEACESDGESPQSRQAFERRLADPRLELRKVLATQGMRGYQKQRPRSDARDRSGTALAKHAVLHVDSTKVDVRVVRDDGMSASAESPLIYLGTDEATDLPMAHSVVFGPARRDGLAILIRNYVRRHGRLFNSIFVDRGTENQSHFLIALALRYQFSIHICPTAGSRFNSNVERYFKRFNSQVSHELVGSTDPDKAGRGVDGKFKSYNTARHCFETVHTVAKETLYEHFPSVPVQGFASPAERAAHADLLFPSAGLHALVDEEFLFRTAIPHSNNKYVPGRGFEVNGRYFHSNELRELDASFDVEQLRTDPEDPSFIWVRTNRGLFKAFCNLIGPLANSTLIERSFRGMYDQLYAPSLREAKQTARHAQAMRTAAANAKPNTAAHPKPGEADSSSLPSQSNDALDEIALRGIKKRAMDDFDDIESP
ncbi:transposase [Stenotrophomonas maltophilia]|jgi:putative transposase|nr:MULTISPECIES: transposase [Stenotrophomonas]EKU9979731.1 transposase [Stenotrophomonas maltophilia]EKX6271787.1 transposase [Stenotrophomonas maltophilia]MBA0259108.1 transposase [Stenotrophomonas maltophilia]MBB1134358.1 transposase [Stenotrophomonas sp. I18B00994]MBN5107844.1 transposase [Stenotrophomonas maltophilia]